MLEPFYPLKDGAGERQHYRDIKEYEQDFRWAFTYIKATAQPNPAIFKKVYGAAAGYGESSTEAYTLAGPSTDTNIEPTSTQPIVYARDYTSVKITKVFTTETGECRTQVKLETGEEKHFPWALWQKVKIIRSDNSQKDGYIAADRYRTWNLDLKDKGKAKKKSSK